MKSRRKWTNNAAFDLPGYTLYQNAPWAYTALIALIDGRFPDVWTPGVRPLSP
jgi:hypothetical protein